MAAPWKLNVFGLDLFSFFFRAQVQGIRRPRIDRNIFNIFVIVLENLCIHNLLSYCILYASKERKKVLEKKERTNEKKGNKYWERKKGQEVLEKKERSKQTKKG